MSADDKLDVPESWKPVAEEVIGTAKIQTMRALASAGPHPVQERLARYYDPAGNYGGATFLDIEPNQRDDVTASDLHALQMLSIRVNPQMTRRLLDETEARLSLLKALAAVPDDVDLATARAVHLLLMEALNQLTKSTLSQGGGAWVTASKLCARKRPRLFPVVDNVVRTYLDLRRFNNYQVNWLVYRALINDDDIAEALDCAFDGTRGIDDQDTRELRMDSIRLKVLDAALWTFATA